VTDYDFGLTLRVWRVRITWRQICRGEEFTPEHDGPHAFASISLTYHYEL
jgi:hypothetical protein